MTAKIQYAGDPKAHEMRLLEAPFPTNQTKMAALPLLFWDQNYDRKAAARARSPQAGDSTLVCDPQPFPSPPLTTSLFSVPP